MGTTSQLIGQPFSLHKKKSTKSCPPRSKIKKKYHCQILFLICLKFYWQPRKKAHLRIGNEIYFNYKK